jgi:3-hydroxyisobutyrate dehydrogenase-like beta-hydroxyacid dehydrogenase
MVTPACRSSSEDLSHEPDSARVGLVGAGVLGTSLARVLLSAGASLVVYDPRPEAVRPIATAGGQVAQSAAQVGRRSDVVLVAVSTDRQCFEALDGDHGLLSQASGLTIGVVLPFAPTRSGPWPSSPENTTWV